MYSTWYMTDLNDFLETQYLRFNSPDFIPADPISVPHRFTKKQDIEIAGLIAAIFSWGQRKTIINKSNAFLKLMEDAPHDFVLNHTEADLRPFTGFVHRTFNTTDALWLVHVLKWHYSKHDSLELLFHQGSSIESGLMHFHQSVFALPDAPARTRKHIPTPHTKSACKRLCMYLRWMVRRDGRGVDFGLWRQLSPAQLICPLDVHSGRVARRLGLLKRKQNDWQAALELTKRLKKFDANDPVKYDFALFGSGVDQWAG
jgi:uncharacterized protein (TIGR02757 family)